MLINSRLFKHYSQTSFTTLASKCNNYVSNRCFSHFKLVFIYIACDYEMHVMLMLMLWDVNACLTPRYVTMSSQNTLLSRTERIKSQGVSIALNLVLPALWGWKAWISLNPKPTSCSGFIIVSWPNQWILCFPSYWFH
jgi:hypothetical protein